jgi:hypothetical protein
MDIIQYKDAFERNGEWQQRSIDSITKIVVHQLCSPAYPESAKDVDNNIKYFLSEENHITPGRGLPYIPYHIVIDDDGKIYWCNAYEDITYHCIGFNTVSIGIGMMGSFDGPGFKGKDGNPTQVQLDSLIATLDGFNIYPFNNLNKSTVYGHCELDPVRKPDCPGDGIMTALKAWKSV